MGCYSLFLGFFLTQGSNPGLLRWQEDFLFFFNTTEPPRKPKPDKNKEREKKKGLKTDLVPGGDCNQFFFLYFNLYFL